MTSRGSAERALRPKTKLGFLEEKNDMRQMGSVVQSQMLELRDYIGQSSQHSCKMKSPVNF